MREASTKVRELCRLPSADLFTTELAFELGTPRDQNDALAAIGGMRDWLSIGRAITSPIAIVCFLQACSAQGESSPGSGGRAGGNATAGGGGAAVGGTSATTGGSTGDGTTGTAGGGVADGSVSDDGAGTGGSGRGGAPPTCGLDVEAGTPPMENTGIAPIPNRAGLYQGTFQALPQQVDTSETTDAPLLGNGDLGVAVLGSIDAMTFILSKNEFWSL